MYERLTLLTFSESSVRLNPKGVLSKTFKTSLIYVGVSIGSINIWVSFEVLSANTDNPYLIIG